MPKVKLCRECAYGFKEDHRSWKMTCKNPEVNRRDEYALAYADSHGTDTIDERRKTSWWAACGQRGKQWTPKNANA